MNIHNSSESKGYLIPSMRLNGPEQMALDTNLLEKSIYEQNKSLIFRFYRWKGFWLSIGKNQKVLPNHWHKLVDKNKIKLVRRPSGGNAVLHGSNLTYSLIWPNPPQKRHQAYFKASEWLVDGFRKIGLPLHFGKEQAHLKDPNCFSSSTAADLVDINGQKRIGSAQKWKKGQLLQHGEILLDPPSKLWEEIFLSPAPQKAPMSINRENLEKTLLNAIKNNWPNVAWERKTLSPTYIRSISLETSFYEVSLNLLGNSITPEASIASTT